MLMKYPLTYIPTNEFNYKHLKLGVTDQGSKSPMLQSSYLAINSPLW